MPYEGHCMCGNIRVMLKEQPASSLRCYCENCARSGGGSSINYALDNKVVNISDRDGSLKSFVDKHTKSGNEVIRSFCGNCGCPVATVSPMLPDDTLVKATLFDTVAPPSTEVFTSRRPEWMAPFEAARQA